jgi:type VI secretion system secreted protein VgrG
VASNARLLQAGTPLGAGVLTLQRMSGKEELGRLPEFQLDFVSRRGDIKLDEILGKNLTWTLELADGGQRYFNGFVTSFADNGESDASVFEAGGKGTVYKYLATVHPWLWFLTRTANCRIFQNLSVPQIVDQVFKGYKFADAREVQLGAGYPKKEFCVQYRETDFNFVCRLLEQEGIYFAFEYGDGKNTLMLMASQGAHQTLPKLEAPFHQDIAALRDKDGYGSWSAEREIQPGRYLIDEYDCMTPRVAMLGDGLPEIKKTHDLAEFEIYDYPGEYDKPAEGTQYAKTRIEELHTKYETFFGAGNVRQTAPGRLLKLQDHPRSSYNAEYLLTGVNYAATAGNLASGGEAAMFSCNAVAISSKAIFRPARLTPKPIVQGTQTAFVVGPAGEEIYTDEYGRIKVQFHWDRYSKTDENSSCWVRVSQPLAGKEWGFVTIPRIGQEVLVDFLEGDPDHPVVIGALYNGEAKPAFKLPDDKSRSGFKSKSYKGSGFNELRFEDKAGSEEIYIHAQKDQSALVEHDRIDKVGNESHLIVGKDALEKLGADHHVEVTGDRNEKLGGGLSLKIGKDMQGKVGTKLAYDAGTEIHLKAGTTLVLEASASLSLHVGGNFITLNSGGVFIKGTMVMINSGGAAGNGSGASPQPPKSPKEAAASKGGQVTEAPKRQKPTAYSPQANMFKMAADSGTPFCEVCNC